MGMEELKTFARLTRVTGPGIVITLDDTTIKNSTQPEVNPNVYIIHDIDLLMLVNELRGAGAEAIAINDQRVTGATAIRCVGPVIHINDHPVSSPFIVQAIGNGDALSRFLNMPRGQLEELRGINIHVAVVKKDHLAIPAFGSSPESENAQVVRSDAGEAGAPDTFTYYENGFQTEPRQQVQQREQEAVQDGHMPWREDALWAAQGMGMHLLPPVPMGDLPKTSGEGKGTGEIQVSADHWHAIFRLAGKTDRACAGGRYYQRHSHASPDLKPTVRALVVCHRHRRGRDDRGVFQFF